LADVRAGLCRGVDSALLEQEQALYRQHADARPYLAAHWEIQELLRRQQTIELTGCLATVQQKSQTQYLRYTNLLSPDPVALINAPTIL
jgi:hypothetical protein